MAHGGREGWEWYRGVVEAAERFMVRWRRNNDESSCLRHAAEDAKSGKGNGGG